MDSSIVYPTVAVMLLFQNNSLNVYKLHCKKIKRDHRKSRDVITMNEVITMKTRGILQGSASCAMVSAKTTNVHGQIETDVFVMRIQ